MAIKPKNVDGWIDKIDRISFFCVTETKTRSKELHNFIGLMWMKYSEVS